ncbi:mechanosensitive ion channel family protein [Aquipuribacter sp. SD81]|uniref:mechanosensitive ion channel family protein n=1 Tax=Aquipuribacter sp. SD81 TaxID=3127703 RepID=UPI00301ACB5B
MPLSLPLSLPVPALLGVSSPEPSAPSSGEPQPTPTQTGTVGQAVREEPCGTGDLTPCGVIHRVTGDLDLARDLAPVLVVAGFVLAVLVVAVVLRAVLHRLINRAVDRVVADNEKEKAGGRRRRGRLDVFEPVDTIAAARKVQRAKAIASILRASVSVVVWTAAVFVILPELGVNITGLVAGAGIVGIALGFGAQTLVQDFISGLFMIAEDQYGVGDVIDMGEATGTVEAIGLRVTRLRAVDGTVWHVRNGEVVRVGNMSQGWSRAVLDVDVAYGEDLTQVMETLKELGHQLREDPDWGPKLLDEPEVWGVEALAADGITVRMILKTVPLEQWVVAREMRRRVKYRFDTLGIEIPFPQRTIWMRTEGPGSEDSEPEADTVGAREASATDAAAPRRQPRGTGAVPVDGSDIPPAPQSTRGERHVASEDAPDPARGEPFSASDDPAPRPAEEPAASEPAGDPGGPGSRRP